MELRHTTMVVLALAVTLAASTSSADPASARGTPGAIVVVGKAHERSLVASAITMAVRDASWRLSDPVDAKDSDVIVACMRDAQPWPCIKPTADRKGFDRVVVVAAETEKIDAALQLVLVGQLAMADGTTPSIARRMCVQCPDDAVIQASIDLTRDLIKSEQVKAGKTQLAVRSEPTGAEITFDGQLSGESDRVIHTHAGKHTLLLQRSGYLPASKDIEVEEGKTEIVSIVLVPDPRGHSANHDDDETPWFERQWPKLAVGVGGAGVVAGVVLYVTSQDPTGAHFEYRDTRVHGVVIGVAGLALGGVGAYFWRRSSSTPTVALVSGGGVVGWAGSL